MTVGEHRKMDRVLKNIVVLLIFIDGVYLKELHVKEDLELKDKDLKDIWNILYDDTYDTNERYARHLEAVTESVLEHLVAQLKHEYNQPETRKNPMINLLKRIKSQLQHKNKKRIMMNNKKTIKKKYKGKRLGTLTMEKMNGVKWTKSLT